MNNIGLVNRLNDAKGQIGADKIVHDLMTFCDSDFIELFVEFLEEENEISTSKEGDSYGRKSN